jgi:predicted O-methyltransferase YrrM
MADMIEPNFERDRFEGQMNPSERKLLYEVTLELKPEIAVEVGTARGGGSTYYISTAMANNGLGILHSIEMNRELYDYAVHLYDEQFKDQRPYVNLHFGNSQPMLLELLKELPKVDLLFLDGGADSVMMVYDFALMRPLVRIGGIVACHDWDNGKSQYLQPILNNEHDYVKVGENLGLVIFRRKGDFHQCS